MFIEKFIQTCPISQQTLLQLTFKFLYTNPIVFWRWSRRRPGVATNRFTPLTMRSASPFLPAPPITNPSVCEWYLSSSFATACVWIASSLVGHITTTPVPQRAVNWTLYSNSTAGTKNARVFPAPVLAAPRTSFPVRSGGIALAWI